MPEDSPLTKEELAQYDKFILQLREEVSQLFWMYNFFLATNSALAGWLFLRIFSPPSTQILIVEVAGLLLSLYSLWIMNDKNKWREDWLGRIRGIEKQTPEIREKYRMWPNDCEKSWKRGLWQRLLLLPKALAIFWFGLLIFSFTALFYSV